MNALLVRFVVTASSARLVGEGFALAVALLAIDRTGSTAAAGWIVALATLPQLVGGPLVGPALDRAPRPWVLVRLAALAAAGAVVAIAATLGRLPLAVAGAGALVIAAAEPLLAGGVSAVAGRGPWATRVFAWDSLAYNVAGLAGPAFVTAVAVAASPAWALGGLALSCGVAAVASIGLTVTDRPVRACAERRTISKRYGARSAATSSSEDERVTRQAARADLSARPLSRDRQTRHLREALRLIVDEPALRAVTAATTLAFAALGGLPFALVAAAAARHHRAADAGLALTMAAAGGLVGSLAMTRRPPGRQRAALGCVAAVGVLLVVMALGSWPVLLAGSFAIGLLDGPLLVALFTVRSDHSPPWLRATVFTITASAKLAVASIGAVLASQLLDGRSTTAGLAAIGAAHVAAAAIGWLASRPGGSGRVAAADAIAARP